MIIDIYDITIHVYKRAQKSNCTKCTLVYHNIQETIKYILSDILTIQKYYFLLKNVCFKKSLISNAVFLKFKFVGKFVSLCETGDDIPPFLSTLICGNGRPSIPNRFPNKPSVMICSKEVA